ncbi:hypothetical protein K435DRAFT_804875 [Dendrothele bispora CBS 962.96]|uniref:NB-ARC domain-containing protein n=1 Tax=Dendrothele bispora (strain CBS 962.96) TaxID=1314807 RepID=A0A4S8LDB2_DENBC|nr:hypothetical protein K435DRAFT_804875 [Dendrothele bispora CBS 962.96]
MHHPKRQKTTHTTSDQHSSPTSHSEQDSNHPVGLRASPESDLPHKSPNIAGSGDTERQNQNASGQKRHGIHVFEHASSNNIVNSHMNIAGRDLVQIDHVNHYYSENAAEIVYLQQGQRDIQERLDGIARIYDQQKITYDQLEQATPAVPRIFYGRDDLIKEGVDYIVNSAQAFLAILGPGGIGKTALAQKLLKWKL